MATRGNDGEFSIPITNSTWINDTGATDHMTFDSRQISFMKTSSKELISTANGNTTSIIGKGSLTLTNILTLDSVLVVPSLEYNLLSVSQITKALNCVVIFWPNFCVFKDVQTKQTIGYGVKQGRLYYLDLSEDYGKLKGALTVKSSTEQKEETEMWLWHRRLGHASFSYLKKLFPSLFSKVDVSIFHCDVCEQAKSHRVPFFT